MNTGRQWAGNGICYEDASRGSCGGQGICRPDGVLLSCTDPRVQKDEFCLGPKAGNISGKNGLKTIDSKCSSVGANSVKPADVGACNDEIIRNKYVLRDRHNNNICVTHKDDYINTCREACGKNHHEPASGTNYQVLCRKR